MVRNALIGMVAMKECGFVRTNISVRDALIGARNRIEQHGFSPKYVDRTACCFIGTLDLTFGARLFGDDENNLRPQVLNAILAAMPNELDIEGLPPNFGSRYLERHHYDKAKALSVLAIAIAKCDAETDAEVCYA